MKPIQLLAAALTAAVMFSTTVQAQTAGSGIRTGGGGAPRAAVGGGQSPGRAIAGPRGGMNRGVARGARPDRGVVRGPRPDRGFARGARPDRGFARGPRARDGYVAGYRGQRFDRGRRWAGNDGYRYRRHHKRNRGVYLSFGTPYYYDYGGYSCNYYWRRYVRTGSWYWRERYESCIG